MDLDLDLARVLVRVPLDWALDLRSVLTTVGLIPGLARAPLDWESTLGLLSNEVCSNLDPVEVLLGLV